MTNAPSLLSEVTFGAFLQYSPRGQGNVSVRSRRWRNGIKHDWPGYIRKAVEALRDSVPASSTGLMDLLERDVTLVPIPRSAPLTKGALWPGRRVCDELLRVGLGVSIVTYLERVEAVTKSSFAAHGERPSVEAHLSSMRVEKELESPAMVVLVDDFITRGRTCLAAASLMKQAFPRAEVRAFALVRTMGLIADVESIAAPCVGTVTLRGEDAWRQP